MALLFRSSSRGFTLIEILVAIGIIGLLIGLIIPAVQAARETARRAQCASNLRQVGIALAAYESTHARYPSGWNPAGWYPTRPQDPAVKPGELYSPFVPLLPHLDQRPLFDAVNFLDFANSSALSFWVNDTVMRTTVDTFLCPSDAAARPPGYGRANLRLNAGPSPWSAIDDDGRPTKGVFSIHQTSPSSRIRDGFSHTVAGSERIQGDWIDGIITPGDSLLIDPEPSSNSPPSTARLEARCAAVRTLRHDSQGGESWFLHTLHATLYNHAHTPNDRRVDCAYNFYRNHDLIARINKVGFYPARSFHPGGVNTLWLDGSVRFVRDQVDPNLWKALSTPAGGEIVDASSLP